MAYDKHLAQRVRPLFARRLGCTEKKMFGGVGFLLYGNMCVGVWQEFLIVRCGKDEYEAALAKPNARPFDITGKPMSGWVMVEPEGIARDEDLAAWVDLAIDYVKTLPAK